jgi:hypothetical protein
VGVVLVVGDFNAPDISWLDLTASAGSFGSELLRLLHSKALVQHITEPTRWRDGQRSSILDLVFTMFPNDLAASISLPPLGKSDHEVISLEYRVSYAKQSDKYRRSFSRVKTEELLARASHMDWDLEHCDTIDEMWLKIKQNLLILTEQVAPLRRIRRKGQPPWWSSRIKKAQARKQRAWRNYKVFGGHKHYLQLKWQEEMPANCK